MFRLLEDRVILIVDDVPLNLIILEQVLQTAGASILKATNGKDALKLLDDNPVEVILTDLQMPVMDGWEMAACIRQSDSWYREIPIIATTSETEQAELQKCSEVGINEVINKPVDPSIVCARIQEALTRSKDRRLPALLSNQAEKAFSLSYLKEVTNGDNESLMLIIDNLIENAPLLTKQATDMVRAEKWRDVAVHLHKLKGLIALFEMHSTVKELEDAEKEAKGENPSIERLLNKIRIISDHLTEAILEISSLIPSF